MRTAVKRGAAVLTALLLCALGPLTVGATVLTETAGGGPADSVYVAGAPDLYPLEYYDRDSGCYRGVFPDLLAAVSEQTGLTFTYIAAGSTDARPSLYRNHQVELVTAVRTDDPHFASAERVPVLTVEENGTTVEYAVAFTSLASAAQKEQITAALTAVSAAQKTGWLVTAARDNTVARQQRLVLIVAVSVAAVLIVAAVTLLLVRRRYKQRHAVDRLVDTATGIGNADYYVHAFDHLIGAPARPLYCVAYLALDTAPFERGGHRQSVTEVTNALAARLMQSLSDSEYAAHLSDGAFAVLYQAENADTAAERLATLVRVGQSLLAETVGGADASVQAGYCRLCDHPGIDAESALYHAKQGYVYAVAHARPYHIGNPEQIAANQKAEALTAQIENALQNDEFQLYMQFFLDAKTDRLCGAELLSRWQNPTYGLLRPDEYIPLLTATGAIVRHDYLIFEKACALLARWNTPPFDTLFLSCNFTRLSVSAPDFAERLDKIASRYAFARHRLVVEVTESSLCTDLEAVSNNIRALDAHGFRVAIDDMGAGFSSLADIYDNEINIVKIERNFLATCVTARRRQMLENIITLVHNAGAAVICEGVETAEQQAMLRAIGCDMMQGFYHCRVLPLTEGEHFFLTYGHRP